MAERGFGSRLLGVSTAVGVSAAGAREFPCAIHLDLAGRPLTVNLVDSTAAAAVEPALGRRVCAQREGAMRMRVWCDEARPHRLWRDDPVGPTRIGTHGLAISRPQPPALEVFDPAVGIELWGTRAGLAAGDTRAHPAGTALAAWLATTGALALHAGAVAFDERAVMVVGAGGAGKSTATLACALEGAAFLGDDLCAVDVDDESGSATVHSLFATAKVNPDTDARLGLDGWPGIGTTPKGKRVIAVASNVPMRASARVGAVVVLCPPGRGPEAPVRMSAAQAVRQLAPTALAAALGAGNLEQWFATARAISRGIPTFAFAPSWDLPRVVAGLASSVDVEH